MVRLIEATPALLAANFRFLHDHEVELVRVLAAREGVDPVTDRCPRLLAGMFGAWGDQLRGHPGRPLDLILSVVTATVAAMTTLKERHRTALLVVDVQNGVVGEAYQRDAVVANIGRLVAQARREQVPVVWVQHSADSELIPGSEDWQIVPELIPDGTEPVIGKRYGDSFEDTGLEDVLAGLDVGRLVVAGAETDACIRSTLHGAFTRGYDATLVSDAHTAGDKTRWGAPPVDQVIAHTNLYWSFQDAPGRTAGTVETAKVDFSGPS